MKACVEYNRGIPFPSGLGSVHVVSAVAAAVQVVLAIVTLAVPSTIVSDASGLATAIASDARLSSLWSPYGPDVKFGVTGINVCSPSGRSTLLCMIDTGGLSMRYLAYRRTFSGLAATGALTFIASFIAFILTVLLSYPINSRCCGGPYSSILKDPARNAWAVSASVFHAFALAMGVATAVTGTLSVAKRITEAYPSAVDEVC